MSDRPVFRFAPSPNGELHLGHALSALVGADIARRFGGRFLLRIEDIDRERCREEFVTQIFDDLAWLGLAWEEPVVRQSQRFALYEAAAARLDAMGLLYPCFATRAEIAAAAGAGPEAVDPDGAPLYPRLHNKAEAARRRESGEPFALRLHMDRAIAAARTLVPDLSFTEIDGEGRPRTVPAEPEKWGDAVIVRKEFPASYHLAVVVDDADQRVTHVSRGLDLFQSTGLQRLLQVLLGLPEPVYHHHRLVLDETGRKLSKSARDTSLAALRRDGVNPGEVRARLGLPAHYGHEVELTVR
jgi:glutamyl-Q tRNA(Asp) synthetase